MPFIIENQRYTDENIARPGVGYTVRELMRLQQSAVIPDGSMLTMEQYTPKELGEFGVSPINKIGLELDDIQSIKEFQKSVQQKTALAASAPAPAPSASAPAPSAPAPAPSAPAPAPSAPAEGGDAKS